MRIQKEKRWRKMEFIYVFAQGFIICLVVSISFGEVNEYHYKSLIPKRGEYYDEPYGDVKTKSYPNVKNHGCYKEVEYDLIQFGKDVTHIQNRNDVGKVNDGSAFTKGLNDIRHFYNECHRKITHRLKKRIDSYKRTKIENDLWKIREGVRSLYNCMKVSSFQYLDEFLSDDVIPVVPHLELVKDTTNETNVSLNPRRSFKIYAMDILKKSWIDLVMERIDKLLEGHSFKIRLNETVTEGRGRRRDHRMFAMMMMGFVIMASILVPMGFQFLTVLGGKSLLMAKMALIMSAINGLKKIATSNVGYGLYHAGPEAFHHDPHHHGFHEKVFQVKPQDQGNLPFNIVV